MKGGVESNLLSMVCFAFKFEGTTVAEPKDQRSKMDEMSMEKFRLETFKCDTLSLVKKELAKAGFYYTAFANTVKCFWCKCEFDAGGVQPGDDLVRLHSCDCVFVKKITRSKKFVSFDSLRYEKERLNTFIEWPLPWLSPEDLVAEGFYYIRVSDCCACIFCRGIIGAWAKGDIPREEHKQHFPKCPFNQGYAVGNVPLSHSAILDKLPPSCNQMEDFNYEDDLGVRLHSPPKYIYYALKDTRLKSFSTWSSRIAQTKEDMAEAGFFYCNLSDHVRCFHCGGGLRNWEIDDDPWEEHARYYPRCSYVTISKGKEFVKKCKPPNNNASNFKLLSDEDLNCLMQGDVIDVIRGMGYSEHIVRKTLRIKLERTGLPFFSVDKCIEQVLIQLEEESKRLNDLVQLAEESKIFNDLVQPACSPTTEPALMSTREDAAEELARIKQSRTCKICMDKEISMVFLPCLHMVACEECTLTLNNCPVCRRDIIYSIKPIIS